MTLVSPISAPSTVSPHFPGKYISPTIPFDHLKVDSYSKHSKVGDTWWHSKLAGGTFIWANWIATSHDLFTPNSGLVREIQSRYFTKIWVGEIFQFGQRPQAEQPLAFRFVTGSSGGGCFRSSLCQHSLGAEGGEKLPASIQKSEKKEG